jgi:flagellar basal-body rod modification protein FlgD
MSNNYMWGDIANIPVSEMNWGTTTREPQSDLDREAFLRLLITQLQHQDPLNPMDDRDFIAQMAQFSALEQMQMLNQSFERTQAFNMIGRSIDASFACPQSGNWIEVQGAPVLSVLRQGSHTFVSVMSENGMMIDVPMDAVRTVSEDFLLSNQLNEIFSVVNGQRAADLIGRYIQAITVNGDYLGFVEGRVDSVKLHGTQAILVVGNREVFPHEVSSVSTGPLLLGSTAFTNGGTLTGVDIRGNRAYLVFDGGATRVRIQRINQATEAVAYVGNWVSDVHRGYVQSVTITGGIPFLNLYTQREGGERVGQINFLEYLVNRQEGLHNSGSHLPGTQSPPPADNDDTDTGTPADPGAGDDT